MKKANYAALAAMILILLGAASTLSAAPITVINLNLGGNGDVALVGGVFGTVNDGDASTTGQQDTSILNTGFLSAMGSTTGSFTLSGVNVSGLPALIGGIVTQQTTGGDFFLYGSNNSLLLSAHIDSGEIFGSTSGSTGTFFNMTSISFTGGSLLSVLTSPGAISLSMTGVNSGGTPGLALQNQSLQNFGADATIRVDASSSAPEPSSAALLAGGLIAGILMRKRK